MTGQKCTDDLVISCGKIAVILQNCKFSEIVLGLIVAAFITAKKRIFLEGLLRGYSKRSNTAVVPIVSRLLGPGAAAAGSWIAGRGLVTGGAAVVLVSLVA